MIIYIAGRNSLAVNCTEYLINNRILNKNGLKAICSKKDYEIDGFEPSFKKYCNKNNIEICEMEDCYTEKDFILISLQYDRIIKTKQFTSKKLFNIHFSLLPEFKGMYPSIMPILQGKDYSGVTLHYIDEGIDTGDIIDQIKIDININDTSKDLYCKYLEYGEKLFIRNINALINGEIQKRKQSHINSSYYSKKSIDFSKIEIDLNKTSYEIHNQIRAYIFEDYQLPTLFNKRIISSQLTNEIINRNFVNIQNKKIILSGIDGFKLILQTK